jgi:hypothetical protein
MRTTIDLPDELFREAKTRAVQQGTTLKNLMVQFVRSGLGARAADRGASPARRTPPPVAIRRIPDRRASHALTNGELHALLEDEEVLAARGDGAPVLGHRP